MIYDQPMPACEDFDINRRTRGAQVEIEDYDAELEIDNYSDCGPFGSFQTRNVAIYSIDYCIEYKGEYYEDTTGEFLEIAEERIADDF